MVRLNPTRSPSSQSQSQSQLQEQLQEPKLLFSNSYLRPNTLLHPKSNGSSTSTGIRHLGCPVLERGADFAAEEAKP